jgi:hypothetical protein
MIYARMEEMSFRSGAVAAAGVLAAAGVAIALTVTLSGPAATSAAVRGAAARSAVPSSPVPARPAPSAAAASTASPSARPSPHRTVPAQSYQAPPQEAVVTTPQASALPAADLPNPHPTRPRLGGPDPSGGRMNRVNQPDSPGTGNWPWGWYFGTSG